MEQRKLLVLIEWDAAGISFSRFLFSLGGPPKKPPFFHLGLDHFSPRVGFYTSSSSYGGATPLICVVSVLSFGNLRTLCCFRPLRPFRLITLRR